MISALTYPTLPQAAVIGLIHGLVGGLALTALAAALLRLLGERVSAATRHAIWWGVLLAVTAMTVIPAVRPAVSAPDAPAAVTAAAAAPAGLRAGATEFRPTVPARTAMPPPQTVVRPARAAAPARSTPASATEPVSRPLFRVALPDGPWIPAAFCLWLAVAAVRLVRLVRDGAALARLKQTAAPFEFPNLAPLRRHLARKGLRRPLQLGLSGRIGVPLLAGLSRPRILFPEAMAGRLSGEELSAVVLHEAGHLRRHDDWAALAQHLLAALLWPLPTVAWISRRLAEEQELACDAWVVTVTGARRPYAACLARLAELAAGGRAPLTAPGVIHPPKTITRRIAMLLDTHRTIRPRLSWLLLGLATGLLITAVYQFGAAAPWIVLADSAPAAKAAAAPQAKPAEAKPAAKAAEPKPATKPAEPKPAAKTRPAEPASEAQARAEAAAKRAEAEAERMEAEFDRLGDELAATLEKELAPLEEAMEKAAEELAQVHEVKMEALAEEMAELAKSQKDGHALTTEQEKRMQELEKQMEEVSAQIQKVIQEKIQPMQEQIQEKLRATAPQRKEAIRQAIEQLQQELKRIEEEEKAAPPPPVK